MWRWASAVPRLGPVDARAGVALLIFFFHMRLWTFLTALAGIAFFRDSRTVRPDPPRFCPPREAGDCGPGRVAGKSGKTRLAILPGILKRGDIHVQKERDSNP